jgi:TPR repeat protein
VQKKQALAVHQPEQGKLEPSKPEPSKLEPSKPEPSKPEASKPEPGRLVLTKPEQPKPALQPLDPEEIATLLKRAEDFLKIGDIAAARLALRRAAAAGNAQAALSLGMTFDPAVLAEQGVLGLAPDEEQARAWYQRAAELGSTEASRRLERLAVR